MLISGWAIQSWLNTGQQMLHIRFVQPKECCELVLFAAVKSILDKTMRPGQQPATAKEDAGFKAVLSILLRYHCSRVLAAA